MFYTHIIFWHHQTPIYLHPHAFGELKFTKVYIPRRDDKHLISTKEFHNKRFSNQRIK